MGLSSVLTLHPYSQGAFLTWGSSLEAQRSVPVLSVSFCHTVSAAFVSQEAQLCETLLGVNPSKTWSCFSRLSLVPVLHLFLSAAGLQKDVAWCKENKLFFFTFI